MKKIITLGLSSSGKSCYLGVALGFMSRHKLYEMHKRNRDLSRVTDTIEERMQSGQWVKKTMGREVYTFTKKGWLFDTDYVLHDWNGEYFRLLGLDEDQASVEWKKAQEKIDGTIVEGDDLRKQYAKDCKDADAILLFIDSKTLKEAPNDRGSERLRTRESLYTLMEILRESEKKRVISIILTKSDYLENCKEFLDANWKINAKKVEDSLRDNYNSTFSEMEAAGHKVHVSLVSCIPVRAHRTSIGGRGAVPNKNWSFADLTQSNVNLHEDDLPNDMLAPIRWVIDNT